MISKMRTMAPVIMLVILVAFVIGTIFFDWGMNLGSQQSSMLPAGKIDGKEIPLPAFDQEVNLERQKLEQSSQTHDPYQYHMVPYQVWERKVNELLMGRFFRRVRLYASADEIYNYIKNNPVPGIDTVSAFLTNGIFDTAKYIAFLNDPRTYEYNPGFKELERYAREMILPASKLEMLLSATLIPMRAEIEYQYKQQHDRAVFEYASVRPEAFAVDSAAVTDAMMKACYAANRDTFYSEEQASLYTVTIAKTPTAHDEQVYSHELRELKERIMALHDTARAAMFAEEARILSDDEGSAQNGGELGTFKKGSMAPEFEAVAFSMPVGAVSDPVKTRFGYHLIYVAKREKTGKEEQVTASHILRKIVPTMETLDEISVRIDTLRSRILDGGFVKAASEAAAADSSVRFDSTGMFKKGGLVPGLGFVSGVGRFTFGGDKETVSERLENNDGFYLVAVKKRIPKGIAPFDVVKPRIVKKLTDSLRTKSMKAFAEEWSASLDEQAPLATLGKQDTVRISSGVTDTVTPVGYVPGIGQASTVAAVAFALPVGKRSKLFEAGGTFYLVRPLWKSPDEPLPMESNEVSMIAGQYINQAKQRVYMDWYNDYKRKSKVESNINKIYLD
ncbi:MAG: peptidylprolyl isomerase [Chitinispirillaceae bacterium]|nr:peptidylprolyl isomerase [Chitinispirillaceae bacterium]